MGPGEDQFLVWHNLFVGAGNQYRLALTSCRVFNPVLSTNTHILLSMRACGQIAAKPLTQLIWLSPRFKDLFDGSVYHFAYFHGHFLLCLRHVYSLLVLLQWLSTPRANRA